MSWGEFYSQTFQLDSEIYNKLACLALNQDDKGKFLGHDESKLLDDPIRFDESLRDLDPTEATRAQLEEAVTTLRAENELLYQLFNKVNEERKLLREQNFGLLQKLFELSEIDSPVLDKSYLQFCNRSVFMIKELQQKLLEREHDRHQRLLDVLKQKDLIIEELHAEIDQRDLDISALKTMFRQSLTQDPAFVQILSVLNVAEDDKDPKQRLLYDVVYPAKNRQHRFSSEKGSYASTNGSSKASICGQPFEGTENNLQQEITDAIKEKLMKKINELKTQRESRMKALKGPKSIQERGSSATESQLEEFLKNRAANLSIDESDLLSPKLPEGQENLLDVKDIIPQFDSFAIVAGSNSNILPTKEGDGFYSHRSEPRSLPVLDSLTTEEQPATTTEILKEEKPNQTQRKYQHKKYPSTTTHRSGPKKFNFDEAAVKELSKKNSVHHTPSHSQKFEGSTSSKVETRMLGRRNTITNVPKSQRNSNLPVNNKKRGSHDQSDLLNQSVDLNSTQISQRNTDLSQRPKFNHYASKSLSSKNLLTQNALPNKKNSRATPRNQEKSKTAKLTPVEAHSGTNLHETSKNGVRQFQPDTKKDDISLLDTSVNAKMTELEEEEKRLRSEYKKQLLREKLRAQCLSDDVGLPEESLIDKAYSVTEKPKESEGNFDFRESWNKLKDIFRQAIHVASSERA